MPYDLVLKNAHVIDPSRSFDGPADVAVSDGLIAAVGPALATLGCPDVRDLKGAFLSPGLIDLHGHWFEGGLYGIDAAVCLNHGVTTAVDAGTTGFANFPEFRRTVMDHSPVDLLGFVHISCLGLHAPFAEELLDLRYARPAETAAIVDKHRDRAVGVKVRLGSMTGEHGLAALQKALEAAEDARVPLMVHISAGAPERAVLDRLRPSDILTHCFHGRDNGLLLATNNGFIKEVAAARQRGVVFDIGHGSGSFSWETAQRAFEHLFYPDTLSTDLHRYCVGDPLLVSLPDVMSKFLCLGMSLRDVVLKTTFAPARVLGREGQIGTLQPGTVADIFVFDLVDGEFVFSDTHLKKRTGSQRIEPRLVVRQGSAHLPGSVPFALRPLYECDQVVFRALAHDEYRQSGEKT